MLENRQELWHSGELQGKPMVRQKQKIRWRMRMKLRWVYFSMQQFSHTSSLIASGRFSIRLIHKTVATSLQWYGWLIPTGICKDLKGLQHSVAWNWKGAWSLGMSKVFACIFLRAPWKQNIVMFLQKTDDPEKVLGSRVSSLSKSRDFSSGSPRLMRRPSLVGPSVAVGITTMSASDVSGSCIFVSIYQHWSGIDLNITTKAWSTISGQLYLKLQFSISIFELLTSAWNVSSWYCA